MSIKNRTKASQLRKMSKNLSLEEVRSSYDKRFVWSENPGQKISNKTIILSKIGEDYKTLVSIYAYFFTAIVKVDFLEGRLDTILLLDSNLIFF